MIMPLQIILLLKTFYSFQQTKLLEFIPVFVLFSLKRVEISLEFFFLTIFIKGLILSVAGILSILCETLML